MSAPATTIAVIGREAFSPTPETVERIVRHTPAPIRLVVVDGGSPPAIRDRLDALARAHDFTLVRHDAVLTANEARNLALAHVHTELVAFVDNDTLVDPGWLEGLERCLRETGGAVVSPVVLWGPTGSEEVHFAGGTCHVDDEPGARRLVDHNARMHQPVEAVPALSREPSELIELHCVIARTDTLTAMRGFDESLVAGREEADFSIALAAQGGAAWLEPGVVVGYPWPKRLRRFERRYFRARWSDAWADRSFRAFNAKWRLDVTAIDDEFRRGHLARRVGVWPGDGSGWRGRADKVAWKDRRLVDVVATPLAVWAEDRRRARAAPPRVVHAASWDVAERRTPPPLSR